jgi:predicted TPR repeat methyltransferase
VAIRDARKFADQRSSWVVSDIESFRSTLKWDVITMVESIYYVKLGELSLFLSRIIGILNPQGILVFRVHDLERHHDYIVALSDAYPHMEKISEHLFCIPFCTVDQMVNHKPGALY